MRYSISQAYKILADKMDAQEAYYKTLKEVSLTVPYEELPVEHKNALLRAASYTSWRENEAIVKLLQKTAKKMVKNEKKKRRFNKV